MSCARRLNSFVDKSCSALVSATVIGVNLYYFPWDGHVQSVAVPVFTSACCATAALSKVLKRVVSQARPAGAAKLSPGMPSNHATALSFLSLAACVGLARAQILPGVPDGGGVVGSPLVLGQTAVMAYGLYATGLRVWCGHHTWPQVAVGYGLGSAAAACALSLNYYGYEGPMVGGRIDEAPYAVRVALLAASVAVGGLAFRSILRGSPLLNARNVHG